MPYPCPPLEASLLRRLPILADQDELRAAATRAYGAPDAACVVAAPGTQILIETVPRLVAPTDVAVVGPTYAEHAAAWSRAGHAVSTVSDIAEAAAARVAVVVNPNNPDGRTWTVPVLRDLAGHLAARGGLLVVDEAFADLDDVESLCPWIGGGIIVLRSFGKTYGLAGLRLGFAVADVPVARRIAAALGPWAVSGPAAAIGRIALDDTAWRVEAAAARAKDAARLDRLIARAGGALVGGTNLFRTAMFPDAPGLFRRLGEAGIHVRRFAEAPSRLRFGLPAGRTEWCRLSRVLR